MVYTVKKYISETDAGGMSLPPTTPAAYLLPSETLGQVFRLLYVAEPPHTFYGTPQHLQSLLQAYCSGTKSYTHLQLGWIKVTHVSRRWRALALADSWLWVCIPFDLGQRWAREFANRCAHKLVNITLATEFMPWMKDLVLETYPRTRILDIDYPSTSRADDIIQALASTPSPSVEALIIRRTWNQFEVYRMLDIFRAPQLSTLSITLYSMKADAFPWRSIHVPGLKHLTLGFARSISDSEAFDHFIYAMQQITTLVTFDLRCLDELHVLANAPTHASPSIDPRICWKDLQRMVFNASSWMVIPIVNRLQYPPSADVSVEITGCTQRAQLAALLPFVASRATSNPFTTMILQDLISHVPGIQFGATANESAFPDIVGRFKTPVELPLYIDNDAPEASSDLLLALGPDSVQEVSICLSRSLRASAYRWLHLLRNVTRARVAPGHRPPARTSPMSLLSSILRQLLVPDTIESEIVCPPFPKLVVLDLSRICMHELVERCVRDENPRPLIMPPTFAEDLSVLLQQRRELGVPIQRVEFHKCTCATSKFQAGVLVDFLKGLKGVELVAK